MGGGGRLWGGERRPTGERGVSISGSSFMLDGHRALGAQSPHAMEVGKPICQACGRPQGGGPGRAWFRTG